MLDPSQDRIHAEKDLTCLEPTTRTRNARENSTRNIKKKKNVAKRLVLPKNRTRMLRFNRLKARRRTPTRKRDLPLDDAHTDLCVQYLRLRIAAFPGLLVTPAKNSWTRSTPVHITSCPGSTVRISALCGRRSIFLSSTI